MKPHYDTPLTPEQLAQMSDEDIDTTDMPELGPEFWARAKVMPPRTKPNVSLRVSEEVIDFFKKQSPKGYTGRMAAVLAAYVQAHQPK